MRATRREFDGLLSMLPADGLPPPPPNPFNPPIWVDTTDQSCSLWMNEYQKTFTGALAMCVALAAAVLRAASLLLTNTYTCFAVPFTSNACTLRGVLVGMRCALCLSPSPLPAAITTGQRSPSYLVYSTAGADYPGGLAGRIRGIATVFVLAVLLGKSAG